MKTSEMQKTKDQCTAEIKEYFEATVPENKRALFKPVAEKSFPQLFQEIQNLKTEIADVNKFDVSKKSYEFRVNRLRYASKELIRKVAIELINL